MHDGEVRGGLSQLVSLSSSLCDLKRVRDASSPESLASRAFRRAWGELMAGVPPRDVALGVTADAIVATLLGGIDAPTMERLGIATDAAARIVQDTFRETAVNLSPVLCASLGPNLSRRDRLQEIPNFAERLLRQPRAGATAPGKARITLEPCENHGEHCLVVAVLGVVLSAKYGADPATVFLAGLAHHLHNAELPDSGFAGEILLGAELEPLMHRLFERELNTIAGHPVEPKVRQALAVIGNAETPEGQAFNASDVIDRVLQIRHYDRVAAFTVDQAMDDLELVHAGPLQAFHDSVLREAGLP